MNVHEKPTLSTHVPFFLRSRCRSRGRRRTPRSSRLSTGTGIHRWWGPGGGRMVHSRILDVGSCCDPNVIQIPFFPRILCHILFRQRIRRCVRTSLTHGSPQRSGPDLQGGAAEGAVRGAVVVQRRLRAADGHPAGGPRPGRRRRP